VVWYHRLVYLRVSVGLLLTLDKGIAVLGEARQNQIHRLLIDQSVNRVRQSESNGLAARTIASRLVGSTVVGAAVSSGISVCENWEGYIKIPLVLENTGACSLK
jgi:hypothetical protein